MPTAHEMTSVQVTSIYDYAPPHALPLVSHRDGVALGDVICGRHPKLWPGDEAGVRRLEMSHACTAWLWIFLRTGENRA
jgi:hypothetical protein